MAAGEASPGWVTLLLQACGAHLHGQGCQPSHIPVPTPYGHFPPPQDHVDPSTPSIPSSDPLQLQRSQGGSWGVFPPPHSFCWWVTPHSHLSQACRWRGEEYLVPGQFSNACSLLSAGGRCLHLRLMHILTPQGGRPLLPGHLHHQATKTSGRWRCHLSLLARLFCSSTPFIALLQTSPLFSNILLSQWISSA